jgi:transcriptional regulator with PAS, ATPase and Fis domain
MKNELKWAAELPVAITVCDKDGIIIYMNEKSKKTFAKDGGALLIGKNLYDCHPEPAKSTLKGMMEQQKSNSYTIEKNGIKKLINQTPWFENGEYKGFVELSLEIPFDMPHFVRA